MDIKQQPGSKNRVLTKEQIQLVHNRTLEVMERTGVCVQSDTALQVLKKAGCDTSNPNRVKIPQRLVAEAVDKAPGSIDVFNRNGQLAMTLKEDACYYGTGSDCPHHIDLQSGKRRSCTKEDVGALAHFCDALPNIDFIMSMGIANDAPPGTSFVHQYQAMLLNTVKPVIVTGHGRRDMKAIVDMAACAVGGIGNLVKQPPLILYSEPFSPLTHTEMGVAKCFVCCENEVPFIYIPSPMLGGSGPVTLAGCLVQANVECLSGLVIFQLYKAGAKFIYGGDASALDMRYSTYAYGAPELNLLNGALADLAHFYRLPFFCIAGATDSKTLDAQAGIEYALSIYLASLNGCNIIHDCGYLESGLTASFESILMADEVISMIKYMLRPVEVSDETIAIGLIDEVGPGGTYLTHDHTLNNFRKTMWFPRFFDRSRFEIWSKQGSQDLRQVLRQKAMEISSGHKVPALSASALQKIAGIVKSYKPDVEV